jgi:hypothetical protein
MVHTSREVGMNAAFASLSRAGVVLLALVSPAYAQDRTQAKGVSLVDFDNSIEALVGAVNPSVVQVFVSGLAPLAGVVTNQADLVTPQRGSGSGVIVQADGPMRTWSVGPLASEWRYRQSRRVNRC